MTDFESDFPALGEFSTSNTNLESDPAADFLAREQAILGDEFSNATNHTITSTTSSELEAFPDITLPSASVSALSPPVSSASNVNYAAFHSEFPPVESKVSSICKLYIIDTFTYQIIEFSLFYFIL